MYPALYVQGRRALRHELTACLRTGRALRVPSVRTHNRRKSFIALEVRISERPAGLASLQADAAAEAGTPTTEWL